MLTMANRTVQCSSMNSLKASLLLVSSCGKSDAELCIDKKSHLWNTEANSREENQVYWNAMSQCRENINKHVQTNARQSL